MAMRLTGMTPQEGAYSGLYSIRRSFATAVLKEFGDSAGKVTFSFAGHKTVIDIVVPDLYRSKNE